MLTYSHTPPLGIVLITTFRCNAVCSNCCFGCRPNVGRTMTLDEMKYYVDDCLRAYPDSIYRLSLTGGECFLLGKDLDEIIKYGASKGLKVGVMSNGYWGSSYSEAYQRISSLKALGLRSIGFSVGEEHQNRLPLKGCRNAAVAAARVGLPVEFRVESHFRLSKIVDTLKKDKAFMKLVNANKIQVIQWNWQEYNNEIKHGEMYPTRWCPYGESRPCDSLGVNINITPYGEVVACSGIMSLRLPAMVIGNIWKEPVETLFDRIFADSLKIWIRREGPAAVLKYVYEHSNIRFHRCGDGCNGCYEIFTNPKIIPLLIETYDDWSKKFAYLYL